MDGLMSGMASAGLGRGFTFFEGISDSAQETRMRKINVEFDKMVYNMKVLVAQQEAMEKGGGWMDEYWKSKQKESSKVKLTLDQAVAAQEKLMRLQQGLVGLNNGTITGPGNALANVTPEDLAGLQAFIDQDLAGIENLDAASAEFFAKRQTDLQNLSSASMFFGASLTNAFRKSMDEGADFGDVLGKMLEDVIKQLLAAAAAAFALSVIMASFGMGGFGLAKGASFSQLFTAGFGNMSGLGLSSSNLSGASGSSNKNMNINVTGRIKGNDIVLSNERSEINRIRERGF